MQRKLYLFVYGTLKRGHYNHRWLEDAAYIADVITKRRYPMVVHKEPFPYLLDREGAGYRIKGELYKIDRETLHMLDILEGYPELYNRKELEVEHMGITTKAITYFKTDMIKYNESDLIEEFV